MAEKLILKPDWKAIFYYHNLNSQKILYTGLIGLFFVGIYIFLNLFMIILVLIKQMEFIEYIYLIPVMSLIILIFPALLFTYNYFYIKSTTFKLTDSQIETEAGVFNKTKKIIPYTSITNINYEYEWWLGLNYIYVDTSQGRRETYSDYYAGEDSAPIVIYGIKDIEEIKEILTEKTV